jgi:predicted acetyltransferase
MQITCLNVVIPGTAVPRPAAAARRLTARQRRGRPGRNGEVTDTFPIRDIKPDEASAFFTVTNEAFNSSDPLAATLEYELATFEFDRSAAAFDGEQIVGTSSNYTMQLSVPGGSAAVAGVSNVAVLPPYRRRGIMSAMIAHLLADAAEHGEALAALFASESVIYQRFGFGEAARSMRGTVQRGEGTLIPLTAPGLPGPARIRLAAPEAVVDEMAGVYAALAAARPGAPARDERWWRVRIFDPPGQRGGASALRCLIAEDAQGTRGYALYSTVQAWDSYGLPGDVLTVRELLAADPVAAAALWSDLLSRDLVGRVDTGSRPVDDALPLLLADPRRARAMVKDNLFIRLVDVPAALRQRAYAREVDVVLEVTDPVRPANAGRWRLTAGGSGGGGAGGDGGAAGCERTSDAADVAVTATALGAAYLGGTRLSTLAAAGQVSELRPGALAGLSAALSWDPAPWCAMVF